MKRRNLVVVAAVAVLVLGTMAFSPTTGSAAPSSPPPVPEGAIPPNELNPVEVPALDVSPARAAALEALLPKLAGSGQRLLAQQLGVKEIGGKPIVSGPKGPQAAATPLDAPVGDDPFTFEDNPTVAPSVAYERNVVATSDLLGFGNCVVYQSNNGGVTWNLAFGLPLPSGYDWCLDPSVRAAPDGTWFQFTYGVIDFDTNTNAVASARLSQDFNVFNGPVLALPATSDTYNLPFVGVHHLDPAQGNNVYATATNFFNLGFGCEVLFARSTDGGATWSAPLTLGASAACDGTTDAALQGARPIGGLGANVLACWYNSETDGFQAGSFDIRCRSSADNGASFAAEVAAVNNRNFEVPEFVCPSGAYHLAWTAMFPSLAIDPFGGAHIDFTRDPTAGAADGECGDVQKTTSAGPPYATWAAPNNVAGGAGFQGFGQVVAMRRNIGACNIHHGYLSHVRSPAASPNLVYDVLRRESTDCGATLLSGQSRVSDQASLSGTFSIGTHPLDLGATMRRVHGAWTDRAEVSDLDLFADAWAHR